MAKVIKRKQMKKGKVDEIFPFERENYIIIGIGIVLIILGYLALSGNSVEGFMPLYVAPILLVLGYCIVIPIGILYTKRENKKTGKQVTSESTAPEG